MTIKARISDLEKKGRLQHIERLFEELLGSACVIGKLSGERELYRAVNGKVYTREQLDEICRLLADRFVDTPLLIVGAPAAPLEELDDAGEVDE